MRAAILVLAMAAAAAVQAQAPRPQAPVPRPPEGTVECRFEGWSNDLDEKGQPVRAAPEPSATVVGRLPPPVSVGLDELSVTVTVTGYREGWFRVSEAGYSSEVQGVPVPRNRVVKATGWLPVGGVKALIASKELKAQPAREAPTIAALAGFRTEAGGARVGYGPDQVAVKRLLSCRGSWVELETEFGRGWVEKVCARQLSACP